MAVPTAPTATTLVTEAFIRAKIPNPEAPELTRAEGFLLIEVLKTIAQAGHWRILEETSVTVVDAYVPRYAVPADFNKTIEGTLFKATASGTAQGATSTSLQLAAADSLTEAQALGALVIPTGGNGKSEVRRITAFDTGTKQATITPAWTNTPSTDPYMVLATIDDEVDLPYSRNAKLNMYSTPGTPEKIDLYNDELYLSPTPDVGPYAIQLRHQLDIAQIDLTSSRITSIYTEWESLIVQGVIALIYQSRDDDRYDKAYEVFKELLQLSMLSNEMMSPIKEEVLGGK